MTDKLRIATASINLLRLACNVAIAGENFREKRNDAGWKNLANATMIGTKNAGDFKYLYGELKSATQYILGIHSEEHRGRFTGHWHSPEYGQIEIFHDAKTEAVSLRIPKPKNPFEYSQYLGSVNKEYSNLLAAGKSSANQEYMLVGTYYSDDDITFETYFNNPDTSQLEYAGDFSISRIVQRVI